MNYGKGIIFVKPAKETELVNLGQPTQPLDVIGKALSPLNEEARVRLAETLSRAVSELELLQEGDRAAHLRETFGGE